MGQNEFKISRRWMLGAIIAGAASPATAWAEKLAPHAAPRPAPRPKPATIAAGPRHMANAPAAADLVDNARLGGNVAFMVVDSSTGKVLETLNPELPIPPASTAKTITTLYALETLGADFQFETRIAATGTIQNGVLHGDLVLLGGGDPTLDTDALGDMVAELKKQGLRQITGRFIVDARALPQIDVIDPTQPDQVGYDPGLSGLNLNFNRVYFGWQRQGKGYDLTMDARGVRYKPGVTCATITAVDRGAPVYDYQRKNGVETWSIAASALGSSGGRWLPVHHTDAYTGDVFRQLAAGMGIALPVPYLGPTPAQAVVLVSHKSDNLRSVLKEMLKYSTNLTAEVVGLTSSIKRGGPVASLAASAQRMEAWAVQRFGIRIKMFDHSGLGTSNRVTVTDMVKVLGAGRDDDLRDILKPDYLRDAKGRPMMHGPVKINVKTGTLNFVSNLVGYETTKDGNELIFAILSGDVPRNLAVPKELREHPAGIRPWLYRAHNLQDQLLSRWSVIYDNT